MIIAVVSAEWHTTTLLLLLLLTMMMMLAWCWPVCIIQTRF